VKINDILIVGTGALATFFGARLSSVGKAVTMLGTWLEALDVLNTHGACVDGGTPYPVRGITDTKDCFSPCLALVLIKSWQTKDAASQLSNCLAQDGLAVSLQNGLGNDSVLIQALGQKRVAMGITTLGVTTVAPGIVRVAGEGTIWLQRHPRIGPLSEMLQEAGFQIQEMEDIQSRVWGKLVINAAINPLTAIMRTENGKLLKDPKAFALLVMLAREAALVAEAHGVVLPFPNPERAASDVAERTGENLSSMLRDILRGAPTEVDEINGQIVLLGEKYGVPVPVNRLVWSLIQEKKRLSSAELSDMVRLR
jgi:2-dehydropantoate 2-reductase